MAASVSNDMQLICHTSSHTTLALRLLCGLLVAGALAACAVAQASPEVPGAEQDRPIALVGGTVHPVSSPAIENATILFSAGKIVALGKEVALPENTERVEVTGKHVYPGLIDANSQLGLIEVATIRGSRDTAETGLINPNVKAETAFNPDSELIPVGRSGGVLTVLTVPSGDLFSGLSACMQLDGWTWEDMCLKPAVGLHVKWPELTAVDAWYMEKSQAEQTQERDTALKALKAAMQQARTYRAAKLAHADGKADAVEHDARWEAMMPVLEGKIAVYVAADEIKQIQAAVAFAEQEGLRAVIVGGYDAPLCAPLLKRNKVPVIITGVHRLPRRRDDDYDAPFTLPARLREAEIDYCIAGFVSGASAGMGPANVRNLAYHAATAAAYGLSADEALKSITLYPAKILGVADRIGSLEPEKDATLIVTSGDPLEISTQVSAAYIQGRSVSLSDRHKRLWEKYHEKYRRISAKE